MDAIFKQIVKQVNKIIRILTKVTQQYPKLSEEIDLALFATIKIEKIVNKAMGSSGLQGQNDINEYNIARNDGTDDAFFNAAMETIQNFKNNTFKLERKVNVFINEQETRHIKKIPTSESVYPPVSSRAMKKKVKSKREIQEESHDSSVNLSAIDASIVKLVKKLKTAMNNEESISQDISKNLGHQ